jgi:MYXO-CTERM domain-containing protein
VDGDCLSGACIASGDVSRCMEFCPAGACAGATTCVDGICWPTEILPGDPCNETGSCAGGTCVLVLGQAVCLETCSDAGDCHAGTACLPGPDGLGEYCLPVGLDVAGGGSDGCDCAAAGTPASSRAALVIGLLGVIALVLRRRGS